MIDRDGFATQAGIKLVELGEGSARATMEIGAPHLNGVGTVHGGAIFTLADFAFGAACNSHGRVAVAIDVSISYMKGVSRGTLAAEAREEALTDRLSTCIVRVMDDAGSLVALFKGTAYRKSRGFTPAPAR